MGANLASCHACITIAEDVGGDEVDEAEDEYDDPGADDDAPEGKAERLLARSWLVEIAKHVDAEHLHGESECDESMAFTEKRPVTSKVPFWNLRQL